MVATVSAPFPLEMAFNKLNAVLCNCIIGRGIVWPRVHPDSLDGGRDHGAVPAAIECIEHQVTIGAERRDIPVLGNDVFIGAAKVIGGIRVGDGASHRRQRSGLA